MSQIGRHVAHTLSGDLFAWGTDHVLKLYRAGSPPGVAEGEAVRLQVARDAGLPVPAVLDVVAREGRPGIVLEWVEGPTVLQALIANPREARALAEQCAELHARVHACPGDALPPQRQRLREKIVRGYQVPEERKATALAALETLPDGAALCHGDFHPDNILLTARGPVILDWHNATCGHPAADLARTVVLFQFTPIPGSVPPAARETADAVRFIFLEVYLRRYAECGSLTLTEVEPWRLPVAAARLSDPLTAGEHQALLAFLGAR